MAFIGFILSTNNPIGMFMYLIQVKAVLFTVIFSYLLYQAIGSTPFEFTCDFLIDGACLLVHQAHHKTIRKVSTP